MTGSSKMFASTLTKCLDQLFQTTMLALNDESLQLMQNCGKFMLLYMQRSFTEYFEYSQLLTDDSYFNFYFRPMFS